MLAHAPAKINLVLEVEPLRRGEQKHRLHSVFCTTSLVDTLLFDFESGSGPFDVRIHIEGTDIDFSSLSEEDNTLTKAVEHFKREYGPGALPSGQLSVQLIKSIPLQAGLGGGSSDAATMLRMLCWLAQVEPLSERSLKVARAIGADVPFFLHAPKEGLCAHMGGYGDALIEVLPKPRLHICLVRPAGGVSTSEAYAAFDSTVTLVESSVSAHDSFSNNSDAAQKLARILKEEQKPAPAEIAALCSNNLEPDATKLLPEITHIKAEARCLPGVLGVLLSGSGSALFAICESPESSIACMRHFAESGHWAVSTQT